MVDPLPATQTHDFSPRRPFCIPSLEVGSRLLGTGDSGLHLDRARLAECGSRRGILLSPEIRAEPGRGSRLPKVLLAGLAGQHGGDRRPPRGTSRGPIAARPRIHRRRLEAGDQTDCQKRPGSGKFHHPRGADGGRSFDRATAHKCRRQDHAGPGGIDDRFFGLGQLADAVGDRNPHRPGRRTRRPAGQSVCQEIDSARLGFVPERPRRRGPGFAAKCRSQHPRDRAVEFAGRCGGLTTVLSRAAVWRWSRSSPCWRLWD